MQGYATRTHYLQNTIFILTIMVYTLTTVFHSSHGFSVFTEDAKRDPNDKTESNAMDCDHKLMEDIFVCVSKYNVSVTDFLLAVGGINSNDKSYRDQSESNSKGIFETNDDTITPPDNFSSDPNSNLQVNKTKITQNGETDDSNKSKNSSSKITTLSDSDSVDFNSTIKEQIYVRGNKTSTNGSTAGDGLEDEMKAEIKENVCRHQQEVMECTFQAAKSLIENPACAPSAASKMISSDLLVNDQRYRIKSLLEAVLGQYDTFCAHECRNSLISDMGTCYEDFDLDAKLFMSRESHGAVIGSSSYTVEVFCQNREALVKCLRTKSAQCPESDLVLSAIGLDLELMDKGFSVLCENQYTYLRSLECFESHTPEVGICHSIKHKKIITIASLATLHNWTNEEYLHEACRVRLEHIRCDLDAWANKEDGNCDEHIMDLKRELHCSLIPPPCRDIHSKRTDAICKPHASSNGSHNIRDLRMYYYLIVITIIAIQVVRFLGH